jgi:hypothetical protein
MRPSLRQWGEHRKGRNIPKKMHLHAGRRDVILRELIRKPLAA